MRLNKPGKRYNRLFLAGSFPSLRSQLCQLLNQRNTFYVRDAFSPKETLLSSMDWNDHHSCAALEYSPHSSCRVIADLVSRAVTRSENPGGGAQGTMVGIICPPG